MTRDPTVDPLRELLEAWLTLHDRCTIEAGVCCCGESMDEHSHFMSAGHAPTDHGSYLADLLAERTREMLNIGVPE